MLHPEMLTALSMATAAFLLTLSLGYQILGYMRRAGIAKQVRAHELPTHFTRTGAFVRTTSDPSQAEEADLRVATGSLRWSSASASATVKPARAGSPSGR